MHDQEVVVKISPSGPGGFLARLQVRDLDHGKVTREDVFYFRSKDACHDLARQRALEWKMKGYVVEDYST